MPQAGTNPPKFSHRPPELFQENAMFLGLIGWVVIGLIVGLIVSKVLDLHGDDPKLGIGVGAGGAIVGGFLYSLISGAPVTAWNPWSLLFAAVGAGAAAAVWHGVRSRYVSRGAYTTRRSY
jgi:uncharacterized membrane protein YeaQ/YmgE (transglycosylase-associated protein family)